ncbi:MAG: hypothetical protein KY475_22495 [Planctomycetes bacterium]|nr:hypothetical protein [Planctomycetota bacterium]
MSSEPQAPHGAGNHDEAQPTHEADQVTVRGVLIVGGILAAVVAGAMGFLPYLQRSLIEPPQEAPPAWRRAERPPVEFDQPAQLKRLHAWEEQVLGEYQWQDDDENLARIPVARATEILLERGFPFKEASLPGFGEQPEGENAAPQSADAETSKEAERE